MSEDESPFSVTLSLLVRSGYNWVALNSSGCPSAPRRGNRSPLQVGSQCRGSGMGGERANPMMQQRTTRKIRIGAVEVGGDSPVVVQSMCATRTSDVDATVAQVHQLA